MATITLEQVTTAARRVGVRRPLVRWSVRSGALGYLALMLLIPLTVIMHDGLRDGLAGLARAIAQPIAWHALLLTLWTSAAMTIINGVMGLLTAYVLVRYRFPGKALLNAVIDLPLAIPSLVTGVMLVALLGPQQPIGAWLERSLHLQIIFAPPGIIIALLFITFPFVVRAVQPVLQELDREPEDAAATLGANPWTIFRRVVFPALALPLLGSSLLSFARAIGEFGAIVIVAGNIPFHTETAAVYVLGQIESQNQLSASAMSLTLLVIALSLILLANSVQRRMTARRST